MKPALSLFFASVILVVNFGCSELESPKPETEQPKQNLSLKTESIELPQELKNYQQWNKRGSRLKVSEEAYVLCDAVGGPTYPRGIHANYSINVFANSIAQEGLNQDLRLLKSGSVIVKEKMKNGKLDAVAAMIKKESGYQEFGNNWEYFYSMKGEKATRGKIESCRVCHATAAKTDFIFKNY